MTKDIAQFLIAPESSLLACLKQLDTSGLGYLVVVRGNEVIGGVSDGDIRRGLIAGRSLDDSVATVLNSNPVVAAAGMTRDELLKLARQKGVDPIPVVSARGELIDIFSIAELLELRSLPNRAVIMAGGLGLRLRPLTDTIPKPLLPLAGRPIVEHIIAHLASFGVQRCTLTINYMKHMFADALGDGGKFGVTLDYVEETKQLGTIGALQLIDRDSIEHPFIVTNGDVLTGLNVRELLAHHTSSAAAITMCLKPYQQDVPYGIVAVDGSRIARLEEKPSYRHLISAGFYCMSPEVLDAIAPDEPLDAPQLIDRYLAAGRTVSAFVFQEYWRDIGSVEDYYIAQTEFARGISLGAR